MEEKVAGRACLVLSTEERFSGEKKGYVSKIVMVRVRVVAPLTRLPCDDGDQAWGEGEEVIDLGTQK